MSRAPDAVVDSWPRTLDRPRTFDVVTARVQARGDLPAFAAIAITERDIVNLFLTRRRALVGQRPGAHDRCSGRAEALSKNPSDARTAPLVPQATSSGE
jgi:hypothetical protein